MTNEMDFQEIFFWILKDCRDEYERHRLKIGDNWLSEDLSTLYEKMEKVIDDWKSKKKTHDESYEEYDELIDVINVSLILSYRIKAKDKLRRGNV